MKRYLIPILCLTVMFMVSQFSPRPVKTLYIKIDEARRYGIQLKNKSHSEEIFHKGKFSSIHSDHWIVVTTISYPTDDIRFLAKIPGWKVVIVGDTKTPKDWSYPNCVFLSIEDQQQLGFETLSLVPTKSYARKNIGYLFAISHGAKVIYETDDDNHPTDQLKKFELSPNMTGLVYGGEKFFNPYRHFGQPTLWPRGYPLGSVGENITTTYHLGKWKTPLIQQGVVNGDPDMDAIFRLTRKKTLSILNVTFDGRAPPAIVPAGVFSPFNSQNTLFLYDALWAMLIPTTTSFRVCDIWRGYWAQRLLWEIGGNLGFFPPNAFQKRNAHSYLLDAVEEKDLYFDTERLLKFLKNWRCAPEKKFFDCVAILSLNMAKEAFWKENDVSLTASWIKDLITIGYEEPDRVPFGATDGGVMTSEDYGTPSPGTRVSYWAAEQIPPLIHNRRRPKTGLALHLQDVARLCTYDTKMNSSINISTAGLATISLKTYSHILLIVVFKDRQYQNLQIVETLYRKFFPHIVYCGDMDTRATFDNVAKQLKQRVTFLEADTQRDGITQRCLTEAMKMRYDVDGYLFAVDDVIPNFWHIHSLPSHKLWHPSIEVFRHISKNKVNNSALKAFERSVSKLHTVNKRRFKQFFKNLSFNTRENHGFFSGWSDTFYIPRKYKDDFTYFCEHFAKHSFKFESVVPTVFAGLDRFQNVYNMQKKFILYDGGTVETDDKSHRISSHGNQKHNLLLRFVCQKYIPWVVSNV